MAKKTLFFVRKINIPFDKVNSIFQGNLSVIMFPIVLLLDQHRFFTIFNTKKKFYETRFIKTSV